MIAVKRIVVDFYLELFCTLKKQMRNKGFVFSQPQNGEPCSQHEVFCMFHSFHRKFVSWVLTGRFGESPNRGFQQALKS